MKYYCNQKFWWLTVDVERRSLASCCQADSCKIDVAWLRDNSGQLFNTPELQQERQDMLADKPVASCSYTCWEPESRGIASKRQTMATTELTHTGVTASPELLHIVLGSQCNLTCSYCNKQYSTGWIQDIERNGTYWDDPRFTVTTADRVAIKAGHNLVQSGSSYQLILDEITKYDTVTRVQITGGEPFLYNTLVDLVSKFSAPAEIFSGLGVAPDRFKRILDQLPDSTIITVSAESMGELYEFNRYGNSYQRFLTNLEAIKQRGLTYRFASTISNLTIHGFDEFQRNFWQPNSVVNFCVSPDYLDISVLDDISKQKLSEISFVDFDQAIHTSMKSLSSKEKQQQLHKFVTEFARRRNLNLSVFPEHFTKWINE